VVTLIARVDVALSVVIPTASTLLAVWCLTPALTGLLAGRYVPVDGWSCLLDVLRWCCCPGRRHWPSNAAHPAGLAVWWIATVDASHCSAGDCSDRGQHCGHGQRQGLAGGSRARCYSFAALLLHGGASCWVGDPAAEQQPIFGA